MRAIDADALQKKLTKKKPGLANARYTEGFNDALLRFKSMIHAAPTIEPEIVRCKGCRHSVDYYHDGDCYCSNPEWGLMFFGGSWEFYCAGAERRTDEAKNEHNY